MSFDSFGQTRVMGEVGGTSPVMLPPQGRRRRVLPISSTNTNSTLQSPQFNHNNDLNSNGLDNNLPILQHVPTEEQEQNASRFLAAHPPQPISSSTIPSLPPSSSSQVLPVSSSSSSSSLPPPPTSSSSSSSSSLPSKRDSSHTRTRRAAPVVPSFASSASTSVNNGQQNSEPFEKGSNQTNPVIVKPATSFISTEATMSPTRLTTLDFDDPSMLMNSLQDPFDGSEFSTTTMNDDRLSFTSSDSLKSNLESTNTPSTVTNHNSMLSIADVKATDLSFDDDHHQEAPMSFSSPNNNHKTNADASKRTPHSFVLPPSSFNDFFTLEDGAMEDDIDLGQEFYGIPSQQQPTTTLPLSPQQPTTSLSLQSTASSQFESTHSSNFEPSSTPNTLFEIPPIDSLSHELSFSPVSSRLNQPAFKSPAAMSIKSSPMGGLFNSGEIKLTASSFDDDHHHHHYQDHQMIISHTTPTINKPVASTSASNLFGDDDTDSQFTSHTDLFGSKTTQFETELFPDDQHDSLSNVDHHEKIVEQPNEKKESEPIIEAHQDHHHDHDSLALPRSSSDLFGDNDSSDNWEFNLPEASISPTPALLTLSSSTPQFSQPTKPLDQQVNQQSQETNQEQQVNQQSEDAKQHQQQVNQQSQDANQQGETAVALTPSFSTEFSPLSVSAALQDDLFGDEPEFDKSQNSFFSQIGTKNDLLQMGTTNNLSTSMNNSSETVPAPTITNQHNTNTFGSSNDSVQSHIDRNDTKTMQIQESVQETNKKNDLSGTNQNETASYNPLSSIPSIDTPSTIQPDHVAPIFSNPLSSIPSIDTPSTIQPDHVAPIVSNPLSSIPSIDTPSTIQSDHVAPIFSNPLSSIPSIDTPSTIQSDHVAPIVSNPSSVVSSGPLPPRSSGQSTSRSGNVKRPRHFQYQPGQNVGVVQPVQEMTLKPGTAHSSVATKPVTQSTAVAPSFVPLPGQLNTLVLPELPPAPPVDDLSVDQNSQMIDGDDSTKTSLFQPLRQLQNKGLSWFKTIVDKSPKPEARETLTRLLNNTGLGAFAAVGDSQTNNIEHHHRMESQTGYVDPQINVDYSHVGLGHSEPPLATSASWEPNPIQAAQPARTNSPILPSSISSLKRKPKPAQKSHVTFRPSVNIAAQSQKQDNQQQSQEANQEQQQHDNQHDNQQGNQHDNRQLQDDSSTNSSSHRSTSAIPFEPNPFESVSGLVSIDDSHTDSLFAVPAVPISSVSDGDIFSGNDGVTASDLFSRLRASSNPASSEVKVNGHVKDNDDSNKMNDSMMSIPLDEDASSKVSHDDLIDDDDLNASVGDNRTSSISSFLTSAIFGGKKSESQQQESPASSNRPKQSLNNTLGQSSNSDIEGSSDLRVEAMQADLIALREHVQIIQRQLELKDQELESHRSNKKISDQKIADLLNELTQERAQTIAIKEKKLEQDNLIISLKSKIQELEKRNESIEKELMNSVNSVKNGNVDGNGNVNSDMNNNINSNANSNIDSNINSNNNSNVNSQSHLEQTVDSLERDLIEARLCISKGQSQIDEMEREIVVWKRKYHDEKQLRISSLEQHQKSLIEIEELHQAAIVKAVQDAIAKEKASHEAIQSNMAQSIAMDIQKRTSEEAARQHAELEKQIAFMQQQAASQTSVIDRLINQNADLLGAVEFARRVLQESKNPDSIGALLSDNQRLQEELAENEKEMASLRSKNMNLEYKANFFEKECAELRAQIDSLDYRALLLPPNNMSINTNIQNKPSTNNMEMTRNEKTTIQTKQEEQQNQQEANQQQEQQQQQRGQQIQQQDEQQIQQQREQQIQQQREQQQIQLPPQQHPYEDWQPKSPSLSLSNDSPVASPMRFALPEGQPQHQQSQHQQPQPQHQLEPMPAVPTFPVIAPIADQSSLFYGHSMPSLNSPNSGLLSGTMSPSINLDEFEDLSEEILVEENQETKDMANSNANSNTDSNVNSNTTTLSPSKELKTPPQRGFIGRIWQAVTLK